MANAPVAAATAAGGQKVTTSAWAILAAMGFGGFGAALLFSTGIGPALPAIKSDLGLGLSARSAAPTFPVPGRPGQPIAGRGKSGISIHHHG
jgi:hypothetical protein